MYTISKKATFSAAHALTHLPETHKCHRLHGHNYTIEVILQSPWLSDNGFVADYAVIGDFLDKVKDMFDHRNLNEFFDTPQETTAESLAHYIYEWASTQINLASFLCAVRVSETDNTYAEYASD